MLGLGLSQYIPLVIYIVSIFVIIATVFYRTDIGIYFLVPLLPLQNVIYKMHKFPGGDNVIDFLIISILIGSISRKNDDIDLSALLLKYKVLIFYALLTYMHLWIGSVLNNLALPVGLEDERLMSWKNHMIMPFLFFLVLYNITKYEQICILMSLIFLSLFAACVGFKSNLGWVPTHYSHGRRGMGIFVYLGSNEMGSFFASYFFIVFGVFVSIKNKLAKIPLGLLGFFLIWSTIFTYSRGAYAALLGGLIFFGVTRSRILLVCLIIGLMFWKAIVPLSVVERIEMTERELESSGTSATSRLDMWKHGIKLFTKNPIGYGYDSIQYLGFKKDYNSVIDKIKKDTHNKYIEILVEFGAFGIIIFLMIFKKAFFCGIYLYKRSKINFLRGIGLGYYTCVIAFMISNIFGDRWTYIPVGAFFWIIWAVCISSEKIIKSQMIDE